MVNDLSVTELQERLDKITEEFNTYRLLTEPPESLSHDILLQSNDLALQTKQCFVRIHLLKSEYEDPVLKALEATDLYVKTYAHFTKPAHLLWCLPADDEDDDEDDEHGFTPYVNDGQTLPYPDITTIQLLVEFKMTWYASKFISKLHERIREFLFTDISVIDNHEKAIIVMQIEPWMTHRIILYEYHIIAAQYNSCICDASSNTPIKQIVVGKGASKRRMTYEPNDDPYKGMRCDAYFDTIPGGYSHPHLYSTVDIFCGRC